MYITSVLIYSINIITHDIGYILAGFLLCKIEIISIKEIY
nr:MAG TPA: hypothetical protein [Bacteriophage sp.]